MGVSKAIRAGLLAVVFVLISGFAVRSAVGHEPLVWFNPATDSIGMVGGQGWESDKIDTYGRLPREAQSRVRPDIWHLSRQSAGLNLQFRTNASKIVVRYEVVHSLAMPHMPATGASGVDLYAIDRDGRWIRSTGTYQFSDTITYTFSSMVRKAGEYRLYLPLYNEVKWLEIGVADSADFEPLPAYDPHPIVIYGTSIVQGACASRPGLAWASILERQMDRTVVNLGFSGNGWLEPEIIDRLIEIDACIYLLDCLPNIFQLPEKELEARVKQAVLMIRASRPDTPILLIEDAGTTQDLMNDSSSEQRRLSNNVLRNSVEELRAAGITGIYFLTAQEIGFDNSATVDGVHPGDIGMMAYATACEETLRNVLNEPAGRFTTTKACRQYRELPYYDWRKRHRTLLEQNKQHPPRHVILGNSIVHYWGGEPEGLPNQGKKSWDKTMHAAGVRNFGFGWDRIENVLWRVYQGELDGFQAGNVILMIGTNNLSVNTDEEIVAGLDQLISAIRYRQRNAQLILCGILPRQHQEPRIHALNLKIAGLAETAGVTYADIAVHLIDKHGIIDETLFSDGLHPNAKGYDKIADRLADLFQVDTESKN